MTDDAGPGSSFSRIMACVALSPHLGAVVREAAWLAGVCGAELAFVHAGDERNTVERAIREALPPGSPFGECAVFVRAGAPERVILSEGRRWEADLLFAGALASDPLLRGVLGSVARRLARRADRSVYLSLHESGAEPTLGSVVVAVDFGPRSRGAAAAGADLARRAGAGTIHFVHEYDPRAMGASESVLGGEKQTRYEQVLAGTQRFQLANAVEGLDLGALTPRLACIEGRDLVQTSAYAREVGADLLVLAAPPRRLGLLDRFLGEPTETVLQRFPCSVLLVRRAGVRAGRGALA